MSLLLATHCQGADTAQSPKHAPQGTLDHDQATLLSDMVEHAQLLSTLLQDRTLSLEYCYRLQHAWMESTPLQKAAQHDDLVAQVLLRLGFQFAITLYCKAHTLPNGPSQDVQEREAPELLLVCIEFLQNLETSQDCETHVWFSTEPVDVASAWLLSAVIRRQPWAAGHLVTQQRCETIGVQSALLLSYYSAISANAMQLRKAVSALAKNIKAGSDYQFGADGGMSGGIDMAVVPLLLRDVLMCDAARNFSGGIGAATAVACP